MKLPKKIAAGRHKKKRGQSRMTEFGYKKVEVWFDATETACVINSAADMELRLATFVRLAAVKVAMMGLRLEKP